MKQSPFRFQGNNSQEAKKGNTAAEPGDKKDKSSLSPKNFKKVQSKAKTTTHIRTGKPQGGQKKGGGA
jgi:hypothetical protein